MRSPIRVLVGVVIVATIPILLLFSVRSSYSRNGQIKAVETWHRVHQSAPNPESAQNPVETGQPYTGCQVEDLSWLSKYRLTPTFQYSSRDILTVQNVTSGRPSATHINEDLFKGSSSVNLETQHVLTTKEGCHPLTLVVSQCHPNPSDASHIIFGMQTTLTRLEDTFEHLSRWLPHTDAQLRAIVIAKEGVPANKDAMTVLEQRFYNQNMNVTIVPPLIETHTFPQRYFSIVESLYKARTPETKWLVLMDDDTFFPSIPALNKMLSEHDHTISQYIGSLSENWNAVKLYGLMAFGGAGIFLSISTAEMIVAHIDECNWILRTSAGDVTVFDCINAFSSTRLTPINSLHQIDLFGDVSGFYESGLDMLSLHHWKIDAGLPMDKMHLVSDICAECFLQRWAFPGQELLLTNGYSITKYPRGHLSGNIKPIKKEGEGGVLNSLKTLKKPSFDRSSPDGLMKQKMERYEEFQIDLRAVEQTWNEGSEFSVDHVMGPVRHKLGEELKVSFLLEDSMLLDDGAVKQLYVKRGKNGGEDEVMVLRWKVKDESRSEVKN